MNGETREEGRPRRLDPVLYTAKDVADLLGVSVATVRRLVQLKQLPPSRKVAGRTAKWFREDVDVYLYRLRTPQVAANVEVGGRAANA